MKGKITLVVCLLLLIKAEAQVPVDLENFSNKSGTKAIVTGHELTLSWPVNGKQKGRILFDLSMGSPLIKSIGLQNSNSFSEIGIALDPVFLLTVGKRDLVSQNGWNIFFDKVHLKPYQTHLVELNKKSATVASKGSRTIVTIGELSAPGFNGALEITLYNGSPLINIAAVVSTLVDSTAIIYDAGLVSRGKQWQSVGWSDVNGKMNSTSLNASDTAVNEMVKYRSIMGGSQSGNLAIFPAPHQYFYPLDEAFNLRFVWHGNDYRRLVKGYGLGIRQELNGDNRFVPWFNAPPSTKQRLNFFCLLSTSDAKECLAEVKRFTNNDSYVPLKGYKTLASHFHNEFVMKVVLNGKPIPDTPSFVTVFKNAGIDIVHLGEFHYTAHPKGPGDTRLKELKALFEQCQRLSDNKFLLLPGEEPNEFFGGHWLQIFPRPVYWIMSRKSDQPFVTNDPVFGKVYRVGNANDMLKLLELEKGLAWTAHPRTKGSTGYPDKYKNDSFFLSDRFLGAAWKPMPADLSEPRLGKRVLDLADDMNNWGQQKRILAEADLFTIEPENEMYAHLNVNYLQLDKLPAYKDGWQPVVDALQKGRFFSTTGEVLIPSFRLNGKQAGETASLVNGRADITFDLQWTFPLQFAEIISGDGTKVYRHRIDLTSTQAFGTKSFRVPLQLQGRKWVRLEVWDAAVNGAFTQTVWLK